MPRRHPQIFDRSRLKSGYRGILDRAKADGAVLIRDQDDENLYLVREDLFCAYEIAQAEAQDFSQFVAGLEAAITGKRKPSALTLGRLSWAAELSPDSFRQFAVEYIGSFLRAVNTSVWDRHHQLLIQWRDTAAIESDPELMARITDRGEGVASRICWKSSDGAGSSARVG